jgi:hypothetical protein
MKFAVVLCALFSLAGRAQTTVDLRTQSKSVDFSGAAMTKPSRTGASLPATCSAGETFFLLNTIAGQNLYLCTSANTWTVVNGTGGGGQPLPFATMASSAMVSVTNGANAAYSCNGVNTAIPPGTSMIAPLAGTATETLLIGISCIDSHLKLIAPSNTFVCTPAGFAVCDTVTGSAFTDGIIPLASVVMTSDGSSFTFGEVTDFRASLQDTPLTAGTGIISSKSGSVRSLSVDTTTVPLLGTSSDYLELATPGAPPAGKERVYAKAGAGLCAQDSIGNERCTGSGVMATPGQGNFVPFTLLNVTSAAGLQVTNSATMRCTEFWQKVPYTLNLNYVLAQGQVADSTNYFGFAIYTSAGNRITGATSAGAHVAAGIISVPLSGGPSLAATGDYLMCWANNGSGILYGVNDGNNYAFYLNGNDPSGMPRTFDAGNPVSFSGATITWPATVGVRTGRPFTSPPAMVLVP